MAKFTVDQWSDEGSNDESPYWIIWDEDGNSKKYVYDTVVGETLMYQNDIIAAQALEIERLRALVKEAYGEGWSDFDCTTDTTYLDDNWKQSATYAALQAEEDK